MCPMKLLKLAEFFIGKTAINKREPANVKFGRLLNKLRDVPNERLQCPVERLRPSKPPFAQHVFGASRPSELLLALLVKTMPYVHPWGKRLNLELRKAGSVWQGVDVAPCECSAVILNQR